MEDIFSRPSLLRVSREWRKGKTLGTAVLLRTERGLSEVSIPAFLTNNRKLCSWVASRHQHAMGPRCGITSLCALVSPLLRKNMEKPRS